MIPQAIFPDTDPCNLVERWGIAHELADRIVSMSRVWTNRFGLGSLLIISGARSQETQAALERAGRPTAPFSRSTHADHNNAGCPRAATGADLWPANYAALPPTVQNTVRGLFVTLAEASGLRVGGGSGPDAIGLPTDWNHVDLGPRSD